MLVRRRKKFTSSKLKDVSIPLIHFSELYVVQLSRRERGMQDEAERLATV